MVIAQKGFRDEELLVTKEVLENHGHKIKIASNSRSMATGKLGAEVQPDMAIHEANPDFFDAIVIVGGPGARALADNQELLELVRGADTKKKIIAAICIGPTTLANAGIITGKNVTIFPDREGIQMLKDSGARYIREPVVQDGRIITADGPESAGIFGERISQALSG